MLYTRIDKSLTRTPGLEGIVLDTIDRSAYEPAYTQLARILRGQIASGVFRPGDRLPSESQLCARYGVSRMTVRRVINILIDQGMVLAEQGRGTFVRHLELGMAVFGLGELRHLFHDRDQVTIKLLEARIASAGEQSAQKLALQATDRIVLIRRLVYEAEVPILLHHEHIVYDPTRPLVEAQLNVTAFSGPLKGGDQRALKWGDLAISATVLTDEEAALLKAGTGDPAFRLEHVFYDYRTRPVSWGWFICPGVHLRFTTTVGVPNEGGPRS